MYARYRLYRTVGRCSPAVALIHITPTWALYASAVSFGVLGYFLGLGNIIP